MRTRELAIVAGVAFLLGGCASSHQYIAEERTQQTYAVSQQEMFAIVQKAAENAGMKVEQVRAIDGVVDIISPPSFWTSSLGNMMKGGDKVTVVITEVEAARSDVRITSLSQGDAIDLGRSARVVKKLFSHIDKIVNAA